MTNVSGTSVGARVNAINWLPSARAAIPCLCIVRRCRALGIWPRTENIGSTRDDNRNLQNASPLAVASRPRNVSPCRLDCLPSGERNSSTTGGMHGKKAQRGIGRGYFQSGGYCALVGRCGDGDRGLRSPASFRRRRGLHQCCARADGPDGRSTTGQVARNVGAVPCATFTVGWCSSVRYWSSQATGFGGRGGGQRRWRSPAVDVLA